MKIILRVPHEGDSRKTRAKYFGILGFSKRYMGFVGFCFTINGNGTIELVDISNFNVLARGEKKIQEEMKKLLRGAR